MNILLVKLGAAGDVVRTTALLSALPDCVTWLVDEKNLPLLNGICHALTWQNRAHLCRSFDWIINLEEAYEVASFLQMLHADKRTGVYLDDIGEMVYTPESRNWFDMSSISLLGKQKADELKFLNRATCQDLIFQACGFKFQGQPYHLPKGTATNVIGDVAIVKSVGVTWPMKGWNYYDALRARLEADGLKVTLLETRPTLLEHLSDVQGHKVLVSGDTLAMHFALGSRVNCVTIFNCTSPWEIYGYDLQMQIVSPRLKEFFYRRDIDTSAMSAVPLENVYQAVQGWHWALA